MARLAAARGGRRPRGPADHVRRRRRPAAAGAASSTTCPATRARGRSGSATRAVEQRQTDVLGEVMIALEHARDAGAGARRPRLGAAARAGRRPGQDLARARPRPVGDPRPAAALHPLPGRWCGPPSTAPCAPSRSTASPGPVERVAPDLRDEVRAEVLEHGFDQARNTFTQHYDTTEVDASLLVLPLVGFVDGDDPRMLGTIAAVEQDLMRDGLLLRYRTEIRRRRARAATSTRSWPARSGWSRRTPPPAAPTTRTRCSTGSCGLVNDVGLLSEEYDAARRPDGRQLPAGVQPPGPGAGGLPRSRDRRTPARRRAGTRGILAADLCSVESVADEVALAQDCLQLLAHRVAATVVVLQLLLGPRARPAAPSVAVLAGPLLHATA